MAKPRKARRKRRSSDELVRPTAVDRHVGQRVRARRLMLGISQMKLADAIGITFQQLQKNERGTNRIAASRLYELSLVLDAPIQYFFDDMPEALARVPFRPGNAAKSAVESTASLELDKRETLELVRAYYSIPDAKRCKRVYFLAKALAGDEDAQ